MQSVAKKVLRTIENSPKYNPKEWEKAIEAGCYPYAINLLVNKFFLIGDLIGKHCNEKVSDEELIETLKEELETIFDFKVEEVDFNESVRKDEFKIYLQRDEHTGYYHIYRQDNNDVWSHKFPNKLPIQEFFEGEKLKDTINGWCFSLKRVIE